MLLNENEVWSFQMVALWTKQKRLELKNEKEEINLMKNEDFKYNKNIKNQLLIDLKIQKKRLI